MIKIELKSNLGNLNLFPNLLHNMWVFKNDFVFVTYNEKFRRRIVVPAKSISSKTPKPRKIRGEIVWAALKELRKRRLIPVSWKEVDDAHLSVQAVDGANPIGLFFRRLRLYAWGTFMHFWEYYIPLKTVEPLDILPVQPGQPKEESDDAASEASSDR